jgi:hypothetical protein
MITPILKDPKAHGGTLYTFPSASRDLTRAFSNSEYEFAFSHFACLNLPDFKSGTFKDNDPKGIYLDMLQQNDIKDIKDIDINTRLKWHIQSYVMNYEVAILNGLDAGKYDNEVLRNPSERIFFNWLQKVGAIKFNGTSETLVGYGDDVDISYESLGSEAELEYKDKTKSYRIENKLYTWKGGQWRSRILVSKTVQYIGTIDMINNVNIDYDSFNEIYLNIPAGVGGTTDVNFTSKQDDIYYKSNEKIYIEFDDGNRDNPDYIIGRHSDASDITLKAIYDSPTESYYKNDNGYGINFAKEYKKMNFDSNEDFEFNCVLIYYTIKKGDIKPVRNLYGVLFLEEIGDINNSDIKRCGYIQRYPKFKKGNSWGLKLDLKIDAQPDSQLELRDNTYVDPNESGAGMQMFTEALMQLNDCVKLFYEVKKENTDIEERLYTLENMVSGIDTVYDLRDEVSVLRTRMEMFQPTVNSLEGRLEDIESRITKLETNLGRLISDIKSSK